MEKRAGKLRSRLFGMEVANTDRDDLFATTPALATFRYLVSEASTSNWKGDFNKKLMVLDVKRAFLHGIITRDVFIELPDEDPMKMRGMGGKFEKHHVWHARCASSVSRFFTTSPERFGFSFM